MTEPSSLYHARVLEVFEPSEISGRREFGCSRKVMLTDSDLSLNETALRKTVDRRMRLLLLSFQRKILYALHELNTGHKPFECLCGVMDS